jgi:hypothetical protein
MLFHGHVIIMNIQLLLLVKTERDCFQIFHR